MQIAELARNESRRQDTPAATVPAGIRTILFHVHDDDAFEARLEIALSLARAFGAHLHLLHVTPIQAYTVMDAFGTFVSTEIVRALEEQAQNLRKQVEDQLENEDVSWDYEEVTGEILGHLLQRGSLADLVITGREPRQREFGGPAVTLIGDWLAEARTPLFVVGDGQAAIDPFGTAIVAWNGSYEAANAVRSAVPLLQIASEVLLVRFAEPDKDQRFPPTDVLEYLSRQGIKAELDLRAAPAESIDQALLEYASENRASYIVLGGYSHSRAGEFLFGGVTRGLLKKCPVSLVVAR